MSVNKVAVIGAGIFGSSIALELDKDGFDVTLFEKESDIMLAASRNNHNRIHYGYHYPRSLETTKQSLDGLVSFLASYGDAVVFGFENYYAIAKDLSLSSASQFREFCKEAGIGYKIQSPNDSLMNSDLIAESYLVEEPVYDWYKLQSIVKEKLINSEVDLRLNTDFLSSTDSFDFVINCTYSNINEICTKVGVHELNFRRQDVIIPIFEAPIDRIGLTVMDGPFCSIMPQGFKDHNFLLYHAKYSIVEETVDQPLRLNANLVTSNQIILEDAKAYFPFLEKVRIINQLRTCRAIPINNNDQRLTEVITYQENPNFITVFSGKVTTAVKIAKQIKIGLHTGYFNSHIYV